MSRLLLIDDDQELCELLGSWLTQEGFQVTACHETASARQALAALPPEAVVLDVMLPDGSGLELLKQLRGEYPDLPVLMLSARGEPLDRILGLELGADDYLAKPCHMEELLARLRALLRRLSPHSSALWHCGPISLDTRQASAWVHQVPINLTSHEFKLLQLLMQQPGHVLTRTQLAEHIYPQDSERDSNTIEVFVGRLRKKLPPGSIETVRGLGYRLVEVADHHANPL